MAETPVKNVYLFNANPYPHLEVTQNLNLDPVSNITKFIINSVPARKSSSLTMNEKMKGICTNKTHSQMTFAIF